MKNTMTVVPFDSDAEEAVNGSLLIGGDTDLELLPGDFSTEENAIIYSACQELISKNISINIITLASKLQDMGKLHAIGGAAKLSYLISSVPTHIDIRHYAEIVKKNSIRRQMIQVAERIIALSQKDADTELLLGQADDMLLNLRRQANASDIITPDDVKKLAVERYTMLYENENGAAISTGLRDFDRFIGGGLYPDLYMVAARTSVGKTTFMKNIANNLADRGLTIAFISAEMDINSLTDRDIASAVGETILTIRHGRYSSDLYSNILGKGMDAISNRNIYYLDSAPVTTSTVSQFCTNIQTRYGLDAVFIDYLGLLDDTCRENQNIRLGQMMRKLKIIQTRLGVPVMVAHQLNRDIERRSDDEKEPKLSDLRESGHIEEDADTVLFLFRDSYYTDTVDLTTKIKIAKQRQGPANLIVNVVFDPKSQSYKDLAYGTA